MWRKLQKVWGNWEYSIMNQTIHKPVLLNEVLEYLEPKSGQHYIDCTYGGGGHAGAILERTSPDGQLLGIDENPNADINDTQSRTTLINDNFKNLKKIYEQFFPCAVSGILCDLGLSSIELDSEARGFSFLRDESLDMRFNPNSQQLTAAEILNRYQEKTLIKIFEDFGEVPHARCLRVARAIVQARRKKKFETTRDLVDVINQFGSGNRRIHPATLFFQALRIEVNSELDNLIALLPQAVDILATGGRLAIISFHSLEDRIVKRYFREISRGEEVQVKLLTKKPIAPSTEEIRGNPRCRSAKMRVVEKIN